MSAQYLFKSNDFERHMCMKNKPVRLQQGGGGYGQAPMRQAGPMGGSRGPPPQDQWGYGGRGGGHHPNDQARAHV